MGNIKELRMKAMYQIDNEMTLRLAHENPEVIKIYSEFFEYPNSKRSQKFLHTKYKDKSYMLGGEVDDDEKN